MHFKHFSQQTELEIEATTASVRKQLDKLINTLHNILCNLVSRPYFQHEVLYWFGMCLHLNSLKGKVTNYLLKYIL